MLDELSLGALLVGDIMQQEQAADGNPRQSFRAEAAN